MSSAMKEEPCIIVSRKNEVKEGGVESMCDEYV
jgi:hypothetical protein